MPRDRDPVAAFEFEDGAGHHGAAARSGGGDSSGPDERDERDERDDGDDLDEDDFEDEDLVDDEADEASDDDDEDDADDDESDDEELDAELDESFPLGDGSADGAALAHCPYCGEPVEILLDAGGGDVQEYVEDCEVCCRPWRVRVRYRRDGGAEVELRAMDE